MRARIASRVIIVPLLLLLAAASPAPAQTDTDTPPSGQAEGKERPDWVTPGDSAPASVNESETAQWVPLTPELPQRSAGEKVDLHLLRYHAASPSLSDKEESLSRIEELVRTGEIDRRDRDFIEVLAFLALEPSRTIIRGQGATASYPEVRMRATRLLGQIGGPDATEALYTVLDTEKDGLVIAAAVYALGELNVPPDRTLTESLTRLIEEQDPLTPDARLALAIIDTVEKIDRNSTGITDPDLYRALITLAQDNYPLGVQKKAYKLLNMLRKKGK